MSELELLYGQIDEIEVAMMTTRRADGHLESRAMATQKRAPEPISGLSRRNQRAPCRDIQNDAHINLAFYKDRTREWIWVSALATLSRDRSKIHELYAADWAMWFPDEGDPRHGTPDDPRLVLIGAEIHAAVFLKLDKPQPVVLYELAKGWLTHEEPDVGEVHRIER